MRHLKITVDQGTIPTYWPSQLFPKVCNIGIDISNGKQILNSDLPVMFERDGMGYAKHFIL
jgi:hypothetical protein